MAPPRKYPPGTTHAERQRLNRAAKRASGAIAAQVTLNQETVDGLDRIRAALGETRDGCMARLVREATR